MNVCIFSGRLTRDAKGTTTKDGKFVAQYDLAIPVGWGEKKRTVYIKCVHWNCEKLLPHLVKGTAVTIRGQYDEREYQGRDGETKKTHEIVVAELEFQQGAKREQAPQQQPQTQQHGAELYNEDDQAIPF